MPAFSNNPPPLNRPPKLDLRLLQNLMGNGLIWMAFAFLLVAAVIFSTFRIEHVTGEQVGLLLNRINGTIETLQPGAKIYCSITHDFYRLDKTLQTLEMTQDPVRGDRKERDDLKIKTIDGSDVYVDIIVQYRLDPNIADTVILSSGPGEAYKEKWARDYIRSMSRNFLGELTTEEFYDAGKRRQKVSLAKTQANKALSKFGIIIDDIQIPTKPLFYEEYEALIKSKKLADQAVLEEESKARAAKQLQETRIVEETNRKNVAIEQFKGEMAEIIIASKAEGERARKAADAYHEKMVIGAQATLYQLKKEGEAVLAARKAEAEGIQALNEALEGDGGRNMVKLEYARKLAQIEFSGKPYSINADIERFEHHETDDSAEGAEVKGRSAGKAKAK